MTIWIIRQAEPPSEQMQELRLPFDGMPDLSGVRSEVDMRKLLQILDPAAPPETIARKAEVHWHNRSEFAVNDLVLVPLKDKVAYALAEVSVPYNYRVEGGEDIHSAEIRWLHLHLPKRKLTMLKDNDIAMQKVDSVDARKQVFCLTPSRSNRFVKWRWLLALLLIIQVIVMILPTFRNG